MKTYTVNLLSGDVQEVQAHSFVAEPGIVTFYDRTQLQVAAFNGWATVVEKKTEDK